VVLNLLLNRAILRSEMPSVLRTLGIQAILGNWAPCAMARTYFPMLINFSRHFPDSVNRCGWKIYQRAACA